MMRLRAGIYMLNDTGHLFVIDDVISYKKFVSFTILCANGNIIPNCALYKNERSEIKYIGKYF